jgi:hypothetical protein
VDGIWTDIVWVDQANQYRVENGVVEGMDEESRRRIESARNLPGDGSNYLSLENVQRTMEVLPESLWDSLFPNALPVYTYLNFVKAVAKFPKFCNDAKDSDDEADLLAACKLELSAFLAHLKHESGTLIYVEEIGCSPTGAGCDYRAEGHPIYPPSTG